MAPREKPAERQVEQIDTLQAERGDRAGKTDGKRRP